MGEKHIERHYDNVAKGYNKSRFGTLRGQLFALLRGLIIKRLGKGFPQKGTVFDLACGTGLMSTWLVGKGYDTISGDLSRGMLEVAQKKLSGSENFIGALQLDATSIPVKPKAFDVITSFRFLNLMPPNVRVIIHKEANRVGKGFYLVTYALNSPYQRFRGKLKTLLGLSGREGADLYPATLDEIRKELNEAGIEVISVQPLCRLLTSEVVILGRLIN